MGNFTNFFNTFSPDSNRRGKQFEYFVKWFLENDPLWSTQVDQVWLWDQYPDNWGRDCGIDLVFRHKNGENWAVQAKCYSPTTQITKADLDSFISESNRDGIHKRLLIATTDLIGPNAKQVCDAQDKPVIRFLLSNFEIAEIEYPPSIEDLPRVKRKDKPKPREHQIEAIEVVTTKFKNVDRGQLIMACGTGKTYTTLWIKERLEASNTLVLVPSLSLLSQTLHEWTHAATETFNVLCICSDYSVGKKDSDEIISSLDELAFPVTSSLETIKKFLSKDEKKVIFSTYQSSSLISEVHKDKAIKPFDLVIADEAHRCAGKKGGVFTTVLDAKQIRSIRRLYVTATPRTYGITVKKTAEGRGVQIIGMDDESIFGTVFYRLNFSQAIQRGLLTDYQVAVIGVNNPMILDAIGSRELVSIGKDGSIDAEKLAGFIGLIKAMKDFSLSRTISFHSRVSAAKDYASNFKEIAKYLTLNTISDDELKCDFISGDMPAFLRRKKLKQLSEISDNQKGLLSNSRCLSEGVDLPSLDGVAFINPKQSQVDIIQAVGRAIRLSKNKKIGTIVIPVFIGKGHDAEPIISESEFRPVWDVLKALKSQDDQLCYELDQLRFKLGKNGLTKGSPIPKKIIIDLPANISKEFEKNLNVFLVESITDSWDFMYGLLNRFYTEKNHGVVPVDFVLDGYRLGLWVSNQRKMYRINKLSSDRISRLEAIDGWAWNVIDDKWNQSFEYLLAYVKRNGHAKVPTYFKTSDGFNLGTWVNTQRSSFNSISDFNKKRLEALSGWTWSPYDDLWDKGLHELKEYSNTNGHCLIPNEYVSQSGFNLGKWLSGQKKSLKRSGYSGEKAKLLESLPNFYWNNVEGAWEINFQDYQEYIIKTRIDKIKVDAIGRLGINVLSWANTQRFNKQHLSKDKIKKLESFSFWYWDTDHKWHIGYDELLTYVREFGSATVPNRYTSKSGYKLGLWVSAQRRDKNILTKVQISMLESQPNWLWDALHKKNWQKEYVLFLEYVAQAGTTNASKNLVFKGLYIDKWKTLQRKNFSLLSKDQIKKLESLPDWSWFPVDAMWNSSFKDLLKYVEKYDNSDVPTTYRTDNGYTLGAWVASQKKNKSNLSKEKIYQLEKLKGWAWESKIEKQWNIGFSHLLEYVSKYQSSDVPATYKTSSGFYLGSWVVRQRSKRDTLLTLDQVKKLESLQGWTWENQGKRSKSNLQLNLSLNNLIESNDS